MANSNPVPQGPLTTVITNTVTSLQTRTAVTVITIPIPEASLPIGETQATPPPIIKITTSHLVTVLTLTLTPVITITETGLATASAVTPGLHTRETFPGNSAPPGPTTSSAVPPHGTTSVPAISSSPRPPFSESSGPISSTITLLSTSLYDPSTALPLLPSGAPGHEAEESNKTLVRILPSVLLPLFLIIILAGFILLKRRKRQRSTSTPILHPFNASNTSRPTTFRGNVFVMKKQGKTTTDAGGETLNIAGRLGNPSNLHHGDRGTFDNSPIEGSALPVVNEGSELPVASSDNLLVPASRSEILELQTRLANIEARHVSLPPPEYSSERG